MESTRLIRALTRGLDALTVLNLRDGATVSEVAHDIRLPRTTAYRILETLCLAGFALRDPADDRYRVTQATKELSRGFHDDPWISLVAKPLLSELCADIGWPVAIASFAGGDFVLRETTDHATPLLAERLSAGCRVPLSSTAAGQVYLAYCGAAQRDALLDGATRSKHDASLSEKSRVDLLRALEEARARGYAAVSSTSRGGDEWSLAAPVMANERLLGVVTARFAAAVPQNIAIERFLPKLRHCAARIGASFMALPASAATNAPSVAA